MNTANGEKRDDDEDSSGSDSPAPMAANNKAPLIIRLTEGQEKDVLRQVLGEDETQDWLLENLGDPERLRAEATAARSASEGRLSRSLIRGFSIVTALGPPGTERGLIEIASALEISPSTTHRYIATLVELSLVERGQSRKYRLPSRGQGERLASE
jgi:hypothetical protein